MSSESPSISYRCCSRNPLAALHQCSQTPVGLGTSRQESCHIRMCSIRDRADDSLEKAEISACKKRHSRIRASMAGSTRSYEQLSEHSPRSPIYRLAFIEVEISCTVWANDHGLLLSNSIFQDTETSRLISDGNPEHQPHPTQNT